MFILVLGVVVVIVFRVTTAEERTQMLQRVGPIREEVVETALKVRELCKPFDELLRARMQRAWLTQALAAANIAIFVFMLLGSGSLGDPQTLVNWGASTGLRTTNGEWWRLVTMMFVHAGIFSLAIHVTVLLQLGSMLERFVGRAALGTVYVASGLFSSLTILSASPVSVSFGASGGIFGLYGLLFVWGALSILKRSSVTIPVIVFKRLVPATLLFVVCSLAAGPFSVSTEFGSLVIGIVAGCVFLVGSIDGTPSWLRIGVIGAGATAMALAVAIPLRGLVDVRPEIARVVAVESRTADAYKAVLDRFKKGKVGTEALVQTIDRAIMPELVAADARLKTYNRVPPEHQPLVTSAQEYLRLREESWRLRAEGLRNIMASTKPRPSRKAPIVDENPQVRAEALHRTNVATLGKAEATERASLEALERIRDGATPPAPQPSTSTH
jgi:rhomboid protease GluP